MTTNIWVSVSDPLWCVRAKNGDSAKKASDNINLPKHGRFLATDLTGKWRCKRTANGTDQIQKWHY